MTTVITRPVPDQACQALERAGAHPLLARLLAARGVSSAEELDTSLASLLPFTLLSGSDAAAALLADAIAGRKRLLIVADYDCDGATACAVGLRALRQFGAEVDFLVPNRFETGYGLSPEVARLAAARRPDVLITVDNGIASVAGVAEAKRLGMQVIVTDHHLPGDELPAADAIVNPNQPGCQFPSKAMAGVGVMFYVMLALRAELRKRGAFNASPEPNLAELLDLVALGTVADVVPLDRNNRILVAQGLARIRKGRMQAGVGALFQVSGRAPERAASADFGFMLGPRLNAAGRLSDMSIGIECLATDSPARALELALTLDGMNRERRSIEADMRDGADALLSQVTPGDHFALSLFDPAWHQGVIGILAGRVKEEFHRPTFAFARADETVCDGQVKGSGRSIPGLHLRDALDLVSKRHTGLLLKFGGHAAAAGVTLMERDLPVFEAAFEKAAKELLPPAALTRTLETDGSLAVEFRDVATAQMLRDGVWGQAFPAPVFLDRFDVVSQRILKEKHLKLSLRSGCSTLDGIFFGHAQPVGGQIEAAYQLELNEWNGELRVQALLSHLN